MIIYQENITRITKGPQFETKGGVFLFFLAFFIIFLSGDCFIKQKFIYALLSLFISTLLLYLVIDIRGIEIDHFEYKIRDYRNLLGFRIGKWEDIRDYKSVSISLRNVKEATSEGSDHDFDVYFYYYVNLINKPDNKILFLAEFEEKEKAKQFANKIASKLNIKFE
jgi:hypothetical protein